MPSLDQIGHEAFNRDQQDFLVLVKGYALDRLVLPDLLWPVLVALDFSMLFQRSEHHDERNALLVYHSPEIFDRGVQRALRRNEQLVVPLYGCVDVICVDIRIINVFIALDQPDTRMLDCHSERKLVRLCYLPGKKIIGLRYLQGLSSA